MGDRAVDVQKAIGDVISNNSALTTLGVTAVYKIPPENAVFPYITIGDIIISSRNVKVENWFEYNINVHVWDQSTSQQRAQNILSALYDALDRKTLTVGSYSPSTYWVQSFVTPEPDRKTQHGIFMLRVED